MSRTRLAELCFTCTLVLAAVAAPAQTFTSLHSFDGTDGANPYYVYLAQGTDGNLYGTTSSGTGASADGTIFRITPAGTLKTIYTFCSATGCSDGVDPQSGLVLGSNGYFYGATYGTGTSANYGTIYKTTSAGVLTTLHSFDGGDGAFAYFGPIQATNGNLYGEVTGGGANNAGALYEITPAGKYTLLHSFNDSDGRYPNGPLVQATNGTLYGTVFQGGGHGYGTVYELTPAGKFTSLYDFTNGTDGGAPADPLVQASNGNLYGTTSTGAHGDGAIFEITPAGKLTALYSFCSQTACADSGYSYSRLIQATDGNFYGTTLNGGAHGSGTIFKITPAGTFTTLYSFCAVKPGSICLDGATPYEGLVQATNGTFYGVTSAGGTDNLGTVFSLSTGLKPFVKTVTTSGKVGASVMVLGTNLTGTTAVSFNGTAATPTKITATEIVTTVPAGAGTGKITVTTPGGVLTSNVAYRVTPQITSFSPASGPAGTAVTITGVSLTKASVVTFGGVKATTFTVNTDSQVTATVPTGALTGKIAITTPGGTALSATSFTVTP